MNLEHREWVYDHKRHEGEYVVHNFQIDKNSQVEVPVSWQAHPLDDVRCGVRVYNCLKNWNIRVLGDLSRYTYADLLKIKNFGRVSLAELIFELNRRPDT
jgi:DNA-directed RNA polymerase alpha subunit